MSVIDFLKEKSDRLAKSRDELIGALNPSVRGYVNEALNLARNSQWFGWIMDHKQLTSNSDSAMTEQSWPLENNRQAQTALNRISATIGETTYISDWITIDQERIDRFAAVTEDQQWIHTDPERAEKESPFRSTIAHGFLTLSMIPKLIGVVDPENPPHPEAKMVVNVGMNQVRYPYPVKVNSRIRATKKVIDVTPVRRGLEVTEEITIEIEGCRRPGCVAETVLMLFF
ncbi:MAG: MaoC family dehydratase [Reinekea sp.]|jgi:acyl dehydratase